MSPRSLLASAIIALGYAATAAAVPQELFRDTITTINPGAPGTFAGATFRYENEIRFDTDPGTLNTTLNLQPVATNIAIAGRGASTTSVATLPDGTTSSPVSITGDATGAGGWTFSYDGTASAVPGLSFITNAIVGGRHALVFSGGGLNFVAAGGTFISTVNILGDFSAAAAHSAATFSAGYTLGQDFFFDGTHTIVSVATQNYQPGVNPNIQFTLFGDRVVPAPGGLPLLALGLLGLCLARRRLSLH